MNEDSKYSALQYVLLALVPYSKPNMQLIFKPGKFFHELEKISNLKRKRLERAYYYALHHGYAERKTGGLVLTAKGKDKVSPYVAQKLDRDVYLMVIFDVPEVMRAKRRVLRRYLQSRGFRQVQRSVWVSGLDYRSELQQLIADHGLHDCVEMYESARA